MGTLAAQLVHAAGETGPSKPGTHAVVLSAKDEKHLLKIEHQLSRNKIKHHSIREPDSPWNGQLMAIGLYPISDRREAKPITKKLRLLSGGKNENRCEENEKRSASQEPDVVLQRNGSPKRETTYDETKWWDSVRSGGKRLLELFRIWK